MSKRRWVVLAVTFLGILALASPQYGVGQGDSKKDMKESKDKDMPPGSKEGTGLGPPTPGTVLPMDLQNALRFTAEQKKALSELQKEVDARLDKILTNEQKKAIKELKEKGPGIFDKKKRD